MVSLKWGAEWSFFVPNRFYKPYCVNSALKHHNNEKMKIQSSQAKWFFLGLYGSHPPVLADGKSRGSNVWQKTLLSSSMYPRTIYPSQGLCCMNRA